MESEHALWVALVGTAVVAAAVVQAAARRMRLPSLVGYLALGMLLRVADSRWQVLGSRGSAAFGLLADLGVVVLLFRVGLESDIAGLLRKLRPAALVWIGDVTVSGAFGYFAARHWGGLDLVPALAIAAALTATSITVSAAVWEELDALRSPNGQLLLDVAELDDISGVALMALLFAIAPLLAAGESRLGSAVLAAGALFLAKFAAFAGLCYLAARRVEPRMSRALAALRPAPQRMLAVLGMGLLIAAGASALGFSLAIGALFAGLVFSRDPVAVKTETRLEAVYALLGPFFFIGIGLQLDVAALSDGLHLGAWLLAAAIAGKMLGAGLPAMRYAGRSGAALIGASMIPRAEVAMIVAYQARAGGLLGETAYAALVVVAAGTCLFSPWLVHGMLTRWPRATGAPTRAVSG